MVMHKKGHVLELKFPLTNEELRCMGFIFVDDTDLIVIAKESENIEDVKVRQQQGTLCWEKTLEITGGALKPSKCYWYLIDFQWQKGEWEYKITANSECTILGDKEQVT